jgi:hypothetical protein
LTICQLEAGQLLARRRQLAGQLASGFDVLQKKSHQKGQLITILPMAGQLRVEKGMVRQLMARSQTVGHLMAGNPMVQQLAERQVTFHQQSFFPGTIWQISGDPSFSIYLKIKVV